MSQLNREQIKACRPHGGVSLVLAGAGTGKTSTLVQKIVNVIKGIQVCPENILVLTFSRAAAGELKQRLSSIIGEAAKKITAGTFHSFCLNLLIRYKPVFIDLFKFSDFPDLIDEYSKYLFIKKTIFREIEQYKGLSAGVLLDCALGMDRMKKSDRDKLEEHGIIKRLRSVLDLYKDYKRENCLMDYDDLIEFACALLEKNNYILVNVRDQYRFVFVDEFQDTASDNMRLLKLLVPADGDLFAVGDDWQSIYGFRGADPGFIISIKRHFSSAKVYRLHRNYRSHSEIVRLSNSFIRINRRRTAKKLSSALGRGGVIKRYMVDGFEDEPGLALSILRKTKASGLSIVVICRNNWQCEFIRSRISSEAVMTGAAIMTMHASKGLEFDAVIVCGISDIIIPNKNSDIEEERRLLYVAVTRARKSLHLVAHKGTDGRPGIFARELGFDRAFYIDS
jgi:DNA helicase-2/ATP-dependent DNA helicase PcrA